MVNKKLYIPEYYLRVKRAALNSPGKRLWYRFSEATSWSVLSLLGFKYICPGWIVEVSFTWNLGCVTLIERKFRLPQIRGIKDEAPQTKRDRPPSSTASPW